MPARQYLTQVEAVLATALPDELAAVWITGSLVTGDFSESHSDIDVMAVSHHPIRDYVKQSLARNLSHEVLPCPALGLDLILYEVAHLDPVVRAPLYAFSLATGRQWDDHVSLGGPYGGGLIDLAVTRAHGAALRGDHPARLVGPVPDAWLREELLSGLDWHAKHVHDPFHDPTGSNAVLNACRALAFVSGQGLLSKSAGGRWCVETRQDPIVQQALQHRAARVAARLDREPVLGFLEEAIRVLER